MYVIFTLIMLTNRYEDPLKDASRNVYMALHIGLGCGDLTGSNASAALRPLLHGGVTSSNASLI